MIQKSNILFVSPPLAGHANTMIVLSEELVRRGFQVSFATGKIFKDRIISSGVHFEQWDAESAVNDKDLFESLDSVWEEASRASSILGSERIIYDALANAYPSMYKALIKIFKKISPDLVISDGLAIPALDLAAESNVTCIVTDISLGSHVSVPIGFPKFGTSYPFHMSFKQRILNYLHPLKALLYLYKPLAKLNRFRRSLNIKSSLVDLYRRNLMIVPTTFGIEIPRPLPPNVKMVGPIIPRIQSDIPADLKNWLEQTDSNGVVYVSLGTLATMEGQQAQTLLKGLLNDSVKVLWSLREDQAALLPSIPPNFWIEGTVPQQAILSHPAIKVFLSHCGINSVNESLYFGKPIVALPFFGDQHYNAARIVDLGVGVKLDKNRLTIDDIQRKIGSVLKESKYREAAQRFAFVQQACRGLERAADIVECTSSVGFGHLIPKVIYK